MANRAAMAKMPILAIGKSNLEKARSSSGFSLLEILVTLAVIAVIAALLSNGLAFNRAERVLDQQSQRLLMVINWMCESAETDGRILGIALAENSYSVLKPPAADAPDPDRWVEVEQRSSFKAFELPEEFRLSLQFEDPNQLATLREERPSRPQLICAANSELPNFRLQIATRADPVIERSLVRHTANLDEVGQLSVMMESIAPNP
jgi:type II secretion system protein H